MRMVVASLALFVMSLETHAQTAETTPQDNRCWFASTTFSAGATARVSDKVMVCGDGGVWTSTEQAASGCIRDGKLFGLGATESVPNNKESWLECTSDGTWKLTPN